MCQKQESMEAKQEAWHGQSTQIIVSIDIIFLSIGESIWDYLHESHCFYEETLTEFKHIL